MLWREVIFNLEAIGCAISQPYWASNTGADYSPDGEDLTNILFGDEDEGTISLIP